MIEELADWGGGAVAPKEKILILTGGFHTIEVAICLLHIWEGQSFFS